MATRKVFGAGRGDIFRLSMVQFLKPLLYVTPIAWFAAFLVARAWLNHFAIRIDVDPLLFIGSTALAIAVAVLTVWMHTHRLVCSPPASAQRHSD
jgi:putative ABC transport system permease protein